MAELILTDEERAAKTWLELDDATIGKLVKSTALKICENSDEFGRVAFCSAAMLLCGQAAQCNATELTQEIKGFTQSGQDFGDWKIVIQRMGPNARVKRRRPPPPRKHKRLTGVRLNELLGNAGQQHSPPGPRRSTTAMPDAVPKIKTCFSKRREVSGASSKLARPLTYTTLFYTFFSASDTRQKPPGCVGLPPHTLR